MSQAEIMAQQHARNKRRGRRRSVAGAMLGRLALIVACVLTLFPAVWLVAASFSAGTSLYSGGLIPSKTTLDNYSRLFFENDLASWFSTHRAAFVPALVALIALLLLLLVVLKRGSRTKRRGLYWLAVAGVLLGIVIALRGLLVCFSETDFLLWMKNSLVICIPASLFSVAVTVTMAYAFSRFRFAGRRTGLLFLILIQMFPAIMSIVAIFRLLQLVGLINTHLGLILVYGGGSIAFNAWLLKGYMDSIPRELEESAYIDGATPWQAFTRIVFPLTTPMLAVVFLFNLITYYQEYLLASIIIFRSELRPIALGMRFFISGRYADNWTGFAAAAIVASLPILIIFFALQRFLVEGLTKGALKG